MTEREIKPVSLAPGEGLSVKNPVGGILTFKVTGDAPAGSFVFVPRGTAHTWQNVGEAPARFFFAVMPAAGRFEQFFMRYAELPPHDRGAEAFARFGTEMQALEVIGPPLAQSDPL